MRPTRRAKTSTAAGTRAPYDYHVPVMPDAVIEVLACRPGGLWIDATIGGGGHAERILETSAPDGRLIGLDRDEAALSAARRRLEPLLRGEPERLRLFHASFVEIEETLDEAGVGMGSADGALLDLGVSSRQIDDPGRGFSFQHDGPLDMRMDRSKGPSAADLVNGSDPAELTRILREYGEEKNARRISDQIVLRRVKGPIGTTRELVAVVVAAFGGREKLGKIHVATRTFQALRIAVNKELDALEAALPLFLEAVKPGGRLAVISFHSLEDRIVKRTMKDWATGCVCPPKIPICRCGRKIKAQPITRKGLGPSDDDVRANPRARSATLRAVERTGALP
jgi:16S rRNA (cytosine1402-N4)-methyltransferase